MSVMHFERRVKKGGEVKNPRDERSKTCFSPLFNHIELGDPNIPVVMKGEQDDIRHTNTFRASG